jgi:hypothetical protein
MTAARSLALLFVLALMPAAARAAPLIDNGNDDFRKGTWVFETDLSYVHPIRFSDDKLYQAAFLGSYYFGDAVSLGGELAGYYADQPGGDSDTVIGEAGVLLRWHFLTDEHYSLFVDGGIGFSIAEDEVPTGGTHFNYTPRGGVGATIELREGMHLVGGTRFFHLSNGNLHGRDQNPSFDGVQYYLGVMFRL